MRFRFLYPLLSLPLLAFALHCGDDPPGATNPDGGGPNGKPPTYYDTEKDLPLVPASKVDVLIVVDNSVSMGGKQDVLRSSIGAFLRGLPVTDIHVGVISTSLGSTDVCDERNVRTNDRARLRNTAKGSNPAAPTVVTGAEAGFLAVGAGGISDVTALEAATSKVIEGIEQSGCGFEAQLESMYRFLAAPDPPDGLVVSNLDAGFQASVTYGDVDDVLLAQRKAFLRPDSAVAVIMLTDEDDSNVDIKAVGGRGWTFTTKRFPDSNVVRGGNAVQGTTAPRGTSICATNPSSPDCVSCTLCNPGDPACEKAKSDPNCVDAGGYHAGTEDDFNVRFSNMKQRFGVDPQFPIERYFRALTNRKIPRRDAEHPDGGDYVHEATCTNPLFAAQLPASKAEELCNLPEGTRSRQLVFFTLIGGVPNQLLTPAPDWTKILGDAPDPHMIVSTTPRPGLESLDAGFGENGTDPIHGREYETNKKDLQFACTFPLTQEVVCTPNDPACDCLPESQIKPPLCNSNGSQTRGKAYPTIRELRVAKELGDRAIVASICPASPDTGYQPAMQALAARMSTALAK